MAILTRILSLHASFPEAGNQEQALRGVSRFKEAAKTLDEVSAAMHETLIHDELGIKLLHAVFGNSPYLSQLLLKHTAFFYQILQFGFERKMDTIIAHVNHVSASCLKQQGLMAELRVAKQKTSLLIALADISGFWGVTEVTHSLSRFAESALCAAVNFLLLDAHQQGELSLPDTMQPSKESGLIVLAMGKLGACELNYSSDIDLIIFFDAEKTPYSGSRDVRQFFIRLVHNLVKIMQERTHDGYVFRTDLRLRPDPASTPVAISVSAALTYYESLGQNWERAAMIKACPIAGDKRAGRELLRQLIPYVWRKYLDFSSIQDIHSIKRQIESKQGNLPDNMGGYNLKIGHGGIREIEFYAQTQQLIWGGRQPELRVPATCKALLALTETQHVKPEVAAELISIYEFLRKAEHRLQMIDDNQTHTLPKDDQRLQEVAVFLNYKSAKAFTDDLKQKLATVQEHYAALFKESPGLSSKGSLVFTGTDVDPETVDTLEKLGFGNGRVVAEIIRGWHHGRYRALKTRKARELLTELTPALLKALSQTMLPDTAFLQFDKFLSGLPSGVQIFSLFTANPELLEMIAEVIGSYPFFAENLSRRPALLEYMLYPEFLEPISDKEGLLQEFEEDLLQATHYEDILDRTRRWAHDKEFQIGVQLIKHIITPRDARGYLTDIAEVVLVVLLDKVRRHFEEKHGKVDGGEYCVLAMGKLGSRQLSFGSDVDLVLVYNVPDAESRSDGKEPLSANQYYTRLSRRFLSSFSAPTREGKLYDMDLRLRPAGENAPIATNIQSFDVYYDASAWTWEYMALTRARVIAGDANISEQITRMIFDKLTRSRDRKMLASDIETMREKIDQQYHTDDIWNIKHVRGGLIDTEFIAQFLQLAHAHDHPEILDVNTRQVFAKLAKSDLLPDMLSIELQEVVAFLLDVQSVQRLVYEDSLKQQYVPDGVKKVLTRVMNEISFEELEKKLAEAEIFIQTQFSQIIEKRGQDET